MTAIPAAFEPPSLARAWELTMKHVATFLAVAIAALVVGGIAGGVFLLLTYLGTGALSLALGGGTGPELSFAILGGYLTGSIGTFPLLLIWLLLIVLLSAIPAVYFATGEVVTVGGAFKLLVGRPWRYIWAGIVFTLAASLGSLLVVPGIAVSVVGPVYVNKVFTTNLGVFEAFSSSFSAVFKNEHCWAFIGTQIVAGLVAYLAYSCSCALLGFLVIPMLSFYIQNVAYRRGILS